MCALHGTVFRNRYCCGQRDPEQSSSETNTLNKFQLKRQLADVGRNTPVFGLPTRSLARSFNLFASAKSRKWKTVRLIFHSFNENKSERFVFSFALAYAFDILISSSFCHHRRRHQSLDVVIAVSSLTLRTHSST